MSIFMWYVPKVVLPAQRITFDPLWLVSEDFVSGWMWKS